MAKSSLSLLSHVLTYFHFFLNTEKELYCEIVVLQSSYHFSLWLSLQQASPQKSAALK